jgi:hypothetical protein
MRDDLVGHSGSNMNMVLEFNKMIEHRPVTAKTTLSTGVNTLPLQIGVTCITHKALFSNCDEGILLDLRMRNH